ncbi:hypothetical protein A3Q56_06824 [Intoshia linei]|uniref:Uncharacterized protein n=1 Tax=Intoshia linei TaxID=1819745 RepID=A0A177ATW9_9BILA|nr:hypothetical protein A3Q56_06824 [Intoshia linei]
MWASTYCGSACESWFGKVLHYRFMVMLPIEIGKDFFNIFPWHGIDKEFPHSAVVFREAREIMSYLDIGQQVIVSSYIEMIREYMIQRLPNPGVISVRKCENVVKRLDISS